MHTMHSVGRLMLMAAGSGSTSRVEPTGAVLLVVLPRMNSMTHEKLNWLRPIKTIQVKSSRVRPITSHLLVLRGHVCQHL
jgi:hypothetical protein